MPNWLHNRPGDFVRHCMLQMDKVKNMDSRAEVTNVSPNHFRVLSHDTNPEGNLYEVYFGDDDSLPSCTCDVWPLNMYLCKHFFAVMKAYDFVQWSSLSKLYTESPYFSLDPIDDDEIEELDVIGSEESEMTSESEEVSLVNANVEDQLDGNVQNPRPAEVAKSTLQKCLDVLKEMQNMAHNSRADTTTAEEVLSLLREARSKLSGSIPTSNGIYLVPTPTASTWKRKKPASTNLSALPKRRKLVKGTVGAKVDKMRKGVSISEPKKSKIPDNVVEEPVLLDCNVLPNLEEFTDNQVRVVSQMLVLLSNITSAFSIKGVSHRNF